MKRVVIPELLDIDAGTRAEVEASLADLRMVNRWFGGARVMCDLVERVAHTAGATEVSLLDVAAATGDIALTAQRRLVRGGLRLAVTLLDRATSHFEPGLPRVAADALALPFAGSSFDLVGCSLFAHHLEPDQVTRFVTEGLRVARRAVLINDLRRHPVHLALTYAGRAIYRSRLTRHDGPVSIRRAYTVEEMQEMLARTPAVRVEITKHYLYRMGVIAWRA
ncbi:MAG: methyltransferase domain-containing protein [Acidobacteria bacterium]|nr:methyltransferase domain-containing protein [Acidobacteriota bacterium]